jgi:peptidoglycan/LPS O-acetylase OafA/YrhL
MGPGRHFPQLDGLRGLATLLVLACHAANHGMLPAFLGGDLGKTGVAIFYALSGFLMAMLGEGVRFDRSSVSRYAVARVSRVLPLYFLVVALAAVLMALNYNVFSMDAGSLVRSVLLMKAPSILWSVPVEIQFYAAFLAIWLARDKGVGGLMIAALLAVQAVVVSLRATPDEAFLVYWLHFFLIGVVIAWNRERLSDVRHLQWIALVAILLLPPVIRERTGPIWNDLFVISAVVIVMWCAVRGQFGVMSHGILAWYGSISYGLYLLHFPILLMIRDFSPLPASTDFPCLLAIATLAAHLSRKWIEAPTMKAMRNGRLGRRSSSGTDTVADRVGFEPTESLHPRWFSRPVP